MTTTLLVAQPPRGRGPGGPMNQEDLQLVDEFDENDDGWLIRDERKAARAAAEQRREQRGRRGPGGRQRRPGGRSGNDQPAKPGRKVSPNDVEHFSSAELYDTKILRSVFLEFEADAWEPELEAFKDTDVEVPATATVDGQVYPNVGIHFRGASSFGMVPRGKKRSLNLSFDFLDEEQRLYGYKTLNLLNSSGDASMMSTVIYSLFHNEAGLFHFIPHDMNEALRTSRGGPPGRNRGGRNRGRIQDDRPQGDRPAGSPRGGPGQAGPPPNQSSPPAGRPLRDLGGRTLEARDQRPPEGFGPPPGGGPGRPRGMRHGGVDLDPLIGLDEQRMPLRSQLLAIPALREQYLSDMRSIAQDALDWSKLGPLVESQRKLIAEAVRQDTKKLASYEDFETAVKSLRDFANKRREFLLNYEVSSKVSADQRK